MIYRQPVKYLLILSSLSFLCFWACRGPSDSLPNDNDPPLGLNNAESVTGTVRSANDDPIAGATVYIPAGAVTQETPPSRTYTRGLTAQDGTSCEDPPATDNYLAATCSAADGTIELDTTEVAGNPNRIVFQKGALRMVQDLSCPTNPCRLSVATTAFDLNASWPRIAVVTGRYDRIEDLLAKLADFSSDDNLNGSYGRVDSRTGIFVYGSELDTNLTIIDGSGTAVPTENFNSISYDPLDSYFDGTLQLVENDEPVFDLIFINSGNDFESAILEDPDRVDLLVEYVNAGGRLYATDTAYDYIEQPFPEVMWFEGEVDDPNLPGDLNAAQRGLRQVSLNATVRNEQLREWLQNVSVNRRDADTPGNPDRDCFAFDPGDDQVLGALTSDGLIPVGNFLEDWAEMIDNHFRQNTTIWISSGEDDTRDFPANQPLTVSQSVGSKGGMVVYSSYHSAEACRTITFWPQERVLQYLIFEAF